MKISKSIEGFIQRRVFSKYLSFILTTDVGLWGWVGLSHTYSNSVYNYPLNIINLPYNKELNGIDLGKPGRTYGVGRRFCNLLVIVQYDHKICTL